MHNLPKVIQKKTKPQCTKHKKHIQNWSVSMAKFIIHLKQDRNFLKKSESILKSYSRNGSPCTWKSNITLFDIDYICWSDGDLILVERKFWLKSQYHLFRSPLTLLIKTLHLLRNEYL